MPRETTGRAKLTEALTNYKTTLYAGVVAFAGIVILLVSAGVEWFQNHTTIKAVLDQLGGLLITTGALAILWDLRGKRDIVDEVLAKVALGEDIQAAGIRRASMDWRIVPWTTLIRDARHIDVHIAYGSTWLSTHSVELTNFAKSRRRKMRYFLPDPTDEVTMKVLAERFGYTPEMVKSKVVEAAKNIAKLSREGNADIRIWYRKGAPTFTCYRFDETLVVTLYQHKVGRGAIPCLMIDKGTFGEFFTADLSAIEQQSHEVALNDLLGESNAN